VESGLRDISDAGEDVCEPCLGIDIVETCGGDKRVHEGGALTAAIGASKEPRFSAQSDTTHGALGGIVGQADPAIGEESGEVVPRLEHIIDGAGDGVVAGHGGARVAQHCDEAQILLKSQPQICAIDADGGQFSAMKRTIFFQLRRTNISTKDNIYMINSIHNFEIYINMAP